MTVTRVLIQVGSTDWAKSLAVLPAQRDRGKAEGELVGRRSAQVDAAVDDAVAVLVWHPGVML